MAFWQRKRGRSVVVYTSKDGRQVALPREKTKHLDHEPDHTIDYWVSEYTRNYETPQREFQHSTDPFMRRMVDQYCQYLVSRRRKSPKTSADHHRMLHNYILPYFQVVKKMTDPNEWWKAAPELADYMQKIEESENQIARVNAALRGFWSYLQLKGKVLNGLVLKVETAVREQQPTPLSRKVLPTEVLAFARTAEPQYALQALLGYFFSLRPQETFALRKADFLAGTQAQFLECCKTFARHGLYGRFAVSIQKQRTQAGKQEQPKAGSKGWVACFDKEAAELVVSILRDFGSDVLFQFQNDWLFKQWKLHGIPDITLKDLRRASCHYLGHTVGLDFVALKHHARHRKAETTLLYLRRPEELVSSSGELDLDA
jgi:hypothetical protein